MLGLDYSFARPGGAAIKAAGYQFVCRYLASAAGKRITSAEVSELQANGLAIVLVFEDYANQALNGYSQGVADAQEALAQADAIGFPSDRPIYFAVDFDASEAQQTQIDNYLRGAISVLGINRVGVYGGYYIVKRCSENGTATWFWQTIAWSGGQQFSGNHIYQNGQSAFAGGADIDEAKQGDYGQWPITISKGVPMPTEQQVKDTIKGWLGYDPSADQIRVYSTNPWWVLMNDVIPAYAQIIAAKTQKQITDLQSQVADLQKQLGQKPTPIPPAPNPTPPIPSQKKGWFWDWLRSLGIKV